MLLPRCQVERCGGYVEKVINGKLIFPIEATAQDALIVVKNGRVKTETLRWQIQTSPKNGILLKMGVLPQGMLPQAPAKKSGGSVAKVMFGKLQLVIEAKDLVVPIAVGRGFVMTTVYRP